MSATPVLGPEHLTSCATCNEYLERRLPVIVAEVVARTEGNRHDAYPMLVRYAHAVHKRHQSGLSLETRAVQ